MKFEIQYIYYLRYTDVINRKKILYSLRFQYCVILDSSKTEYLTNTPTQEFQYCVILDSSKTRFIALNISVLFQYCVILDSSKTESED